MITVEVAFAKNAEEQFLVAIQITKDSTVAQAIELSGVLQKYPEIDLSTTKIGIFSKIVSLSDLLKNGDRIEIYRPLLMDPKQARLLRAKRKKIKQPNVLEKNPARI